MRTSTWRHKVLWAFVALFAIEILTIAVGLGAIGAVLAVLIFWLVYLVPNWADPPLEWRVKCWRLGLINPRKQDRLWLAAIDKRPRQIRLLRLKGNSIPEAITPGIVLGDMMVLQEHRLTARTRTLIHVCTRR